MMRNATQKQVTCCSQVGPCRFFFFSVRRAGQAKNLFDHATQNHRVRRETVPVDLPHDLFQQRDQTVVAICQLSASMRAEGVDCSHSSVSFFSPPCSLTPELQLLPMLSLKLSCYLLSQVGNLVGELYFQQITRPQLLCSTFITYLQLLCSTFITLFVCLQSRRDQPCSLFAHRTFCNAIHLCKNFLVMFVLDEFCSTISSLFGPENFMLHFGCSEIEFELHVRIVELRVRNSFFF